MENKIEKPVTIVKEDFQKEVIKLINSYQLPLFIVEYILKDLAAEVHVGAQKQLEIDSAKYNSALEKMKKDGAEDKAE